jgi:hypothetical protein
VVVHLLAHRCIFREPRCHLRRAASRRVARFQFPQSGANHAFTTLALSRRSHSHHHFDCALRALKQRSSSDAESVPYALEHRLADKLAALCTQSDRQRNLESLKCTSGALLPPSTAPAKLNASQCFNALRTITASAQLRYQQRFTGIPMSTCALLLAADVQMDRPPARPRTPSLPVASHLLSLAVLKLRVRPRHCAAPQPAPGR